MNVQEYISSGIVESYVLGLADAVERAEFERMCAAHAEVKAARDSFELVLESQLLADAIEPPKDFKNKIFAEIEIERQKSFNVIPISKSSDSDYKSPLAPVVSGVNWMRYFTAASVILLIGSTALNFYFFRQYQDYSARYSSLLASQQQLASSNNALQARLQSFESAIALIRDPNTSVVTMPGVPTSPDPSNLATVYWNDLTKEVYLLVNKMPLPATDKQFQLWALVDGKPVDAGVFDAQADTALIKMKNIPRAQAFAITLEKRGGSPTPTMEQLYVLGNVKT